MRGPEGEKRDSDDYAIAGFAPARIGAPVPILLRTRLPWITATEAGLKRASTPVLAQRPAHPSGKRIQQAPGLS